MTPADLFVRRASSTPRCRKAGPCTLREAIDRSAGLIGRYANHWLYHDARGDEILAVVRYQAEDGKQIRPFSRNEAGSWKLGCPAGRLPLYRLPEVIPAETVVVVEGEKCADRLRELGLVGTTSAFGAGSARRSDWSPLAGKEVLIVPDEDRPGSDYARDVARSLAGQTPRPSVRILRLPGLGEGEDIEQWIDRQEGGIAEIRAAFDDLVRRSAAPPEDEGRPGELDRAVSFLDEQTVAGPVPSREMERRAAQAGISKRTLDRAKGPAGVESRRLPGGTGWSFCRIG